VYSTRHADDYHISFSRTNLFKNNIRHSGPVLWNTIESNIKVLPNVNIFKRAYKRYVLTELGNVWYIALFLVLYSATFNFVYKVTTKLNVTMINILPLDNQIKTHGATEL